MPAFGDEHGVEVDLVGWHIFCEAHFVMDAKDRGVFGNGIVQMFDGIKAEDEALDEVHKERSGFFVLGAVGFEPFVIIVLARFVKESEYRLKVDPGRE